MAIKHDLLLKIIHDFKTPLTSINCYVELLEDFLKDDRSRSYLSKIRSASNQLLKQINALYWLTKLEIGRYEYAPQRFNVTEMLGVAVAEFSDGRLEDINCNIECRDPLVVQGDPFMFKQIVDGLLSEFSYNDFKEGICITAKRACNNLPEISITSGFLPDSAEKKHVILETEKSVPLLLSDKLVKLHGGELYILRSGLASRGFCFTFPNPSISNRNTQKHVLRFEQDLPLNNNP